METKRDTSFTSVVALDEKRQQNIPQQYVLPPSQRPSPTPVDHISTSLPVIDLSMMYHPAYRSQLIDQVVNHGIPASVMKDALDSAEEFFDLPSDEKMCFASTDVHKPVRYGTSMNHGTDKVFYWRDFIKHYANPISEWIHLWPSNPPAYR
ncbi:2-oxoglutarate-dependent dioxygenase 21, chloroplastic-like [Bidens hawaiensis]|uniref:2-oxoglutarate-dependent dioxygenase 21, chloroplastic-like n=1 Tax=Bidens hawaiensis TaxID=980011 RepID=UPI0040492529